MSGTMTITEAILLAAEELAIPVSIKEVMASVKTSTNNQSDIDATLAERISHAIPGLLDDSVQDMVKRVKRHMGK